MGPDLKDILRACRELFGSEVEISAEFVNYLQPEGIKAAFRTRAKQTHPDMVPAGSETGSGTEEFIRTRNAYLLLSEYYNTRGTADAVTCTNRHTASEQASWQRRQIYHGSVPSRRHLLGRYLYYRGVISYHTLLAALSWQRRTNLPVGAVARGWGWLTASDLKRILAGSNGRRFGETAIRLGLLTPLQVSSLLMHQQTARRKIGQYFIQQRLIEPEDLQQLLHEFRLHNLRHS